MSPSGRSLPDCMLTLDVFTAMSVSTESTSRRAPTKVFALAAPVEMVDIILTHGALVRYACALTLEWALSGAATRIIPVPGLRRE